MQATHLYNLKRSPRGIGAYLTPHLRAIYVCSVLSLSSGAVLADSFEAPLNPEENAASKMERRLVELEGLVREMEHRLSQEQEDPRRNRFFPGRDRDLAQEELLLGSEQEEKVEMMSQMEAELQRPLKPEQKVALEEALKKSYQDIGKINGYHAVKFENEVQLFTASEYKEFVELHKQIVHRGIARQNLNDPEAELDLPKPISQLNPAPIPVGQASKKASKVAVSQVSQERPDRPERLLLDTDEDRDLVKKAPSSRELLEARRAEREARRGEGDVTRNRINRDEPSENTYRAPAIESDQTYRAQRG